MEQRAMRQRRDAILALFIGLVLVLVSASIVLPSLASHVLPTAPGRVLSVTSSTGGVRNSRGGSSPLPAYSASIEYLVEGKRYVLTVPFPSREALPVSVCYLPSAPSIGLAVLDAFPAFHYALFLVGLALLYLGGRKIAKHRQGDKARQLVSSPQPRAAHRDGRRRG